MEAYNFVWILVGGNFDIHSGNLIKYALVEYCSDTNSIKISKFKKSCFYLINPNNSFSNNEQRIMSIMIKSGVKILIKDKNTNYGYVSNILNGKYIFNDNENIIIENKLKDLVFNECVKI